MRLGEVAVPAATLIPLVLAVLCGFAAWRAYRARRRWLVALSAAGVPLFLAATMGGMPVALTNAQLQALPSYQWSAVLRMGVNSLGDAHPQWFVPSTTACTIAGGDVGSQVPAVDGGCFNAVIATNGIDAREWGFSPGGSTDQAPALQAAIKYAYSRGGGRVFVPAGQYVQKSQIVVWPHVRLQCQDSGTTFGTLGVPQTTLGAVFSVQWGNETGAAGKPTDADILLDTGSTIDDCGFYYPNQIYTATTPIEYGPTILASAVNGGINYGQTATNNFCYNCYSFLDFRGSLSVGTAVSHPTISNAIVEHNWGAPIAYGLRINFVSDWSRWGHNIFHAGAYDYGDSSPYSHLPGWTINNGRAIELGNADWLNIDDEQEWGYAYGVWIEFDGTYYSSNGPIWIKNSQFDACRANCISDTPVNQDVGIFALRIEGNTFTAFDASLSAQSNSQGGNVLSVSGNSHPKQLVFSNNFIFGPTNYVIVGNAIDATISGNTSYPNAQSTIAAAGYAFTWGNGTTLNVVNNIMPGFANILSVTGTVTNTTNTGNFVH